MRTVHACELFCSDSRAAIWLGLPRKLVVRRLCMHLVANSMLVSGT